MSKQTRSNRRKLSLKRETVRRLSDIDLAQVAGGTGWESWWCEDWTKDCISCNTDCHYTTMSKFC